MYTVYIWSGSLKQFSKDYNNITESINVDTKSDENQSSFARDWKVCSATGTLNTIITWLYGLGDCVTI